MKSQADNIGIRAIGSFEILPDLFAVPALSLFHLVSTYSYLFFHWILETFYKKQMSIV